MPKGDVYNASQVRELSQEFGLNDRQISEILSCERVTITKLRKRHGIPVCNLRNRMDKTYVCAMCGETISIRRKDRRKACCEKCTNKNNIF